MKKLKHEDIVSLHEVIDDESSDQLFLVLEYVPGGVLLEWDEDCSQFFAPHGDRPAGDACNASHRLMLYSEALAAELVLSMLHGLEYLHMHHFAHRDIKPQNCLVATNPDGGHSVKIADFGVAHHFDEEDHLKPKPLKELSRSKSRGQVTRTEGTYAFWAPEMCEGGAFNAYSADVWAVGVCVFAMLFGALPFSAEKGDSAGLFEAIQTRDLLLPEDCSPDAASFLRGMLSKDPSSRLSLTEALEHPWLHSAPPGGKAQKSHPVVLPPPTTEEVASAVSPIERFIVHSPSSMLQPMKRKSSSEAHLHGADPKPHSQKACAVM